MFWDQSFDDHETVKVNMFRLTMHAYALFVIYILLQTSHADGKDLMLLFEHHSEELFMLMQCVYFLSCYILHKLTVRNLVFISLLV